MVKIKLLKIQAGMIPIHKFIFIKKKDETNVVCDKCKTS